MKSKTLILYDLKEKSNGERARIIQKLFGYRDKSNYNYSYERPGELTKIKFLRDSKSIIQLDDEKEISKVAEILKKLKVKFEVAKIQ